MNYKDFTLGDWIGHISGAIENERELDGNEMRDLVAFLKTLEQEPKTGHWIMKNPSPYEPWRCSNCNSVGSNLYNYCPNCGADMRGDNNADSN